MKRRVRNTFISLTCLCFLSPATQCWNRQPAAVLPAQNPRLALAPSQCAKREGRRLTHAVVLVKGRRTLCLLLANFSAVCFFKNIPHLLPLGYNFSAHTEQLLRSRRSSTRINTHSSILNLPLCISHPALQLSGLRLYSIQQYQQHRLTLRATH